MQQNGEFGINVHKERRSQNRAGPANRGSGLGGGSGITKNLTMEKEKVEGIDVFIR